MLAVGRALFAHLQHVRLVLAAGFDSLAPNMVQVTHGMRSC